TDIGIPSIALKDLRKEVVTQPIASALDGIPRNSRILVHLDVDVLSQKEMPAAYAPREEGLSMSELLQILKIILADQRVAWLEITEFCPPKDPSGAFAQALIDVIVDAIP